MDRSGLTSRQRHRGSRGSTSSDVKDKPTEKCAGDGFAKQNGFSKSSNEAEAVIQFCNPVHKRQDSLFSTASGYTNYRGFLNLALILLVVSNARIALVNLMKYGVLVTPKSWLEGLVVSSQQGSVPLALLLVSNWFVLFAYWLELLLTSGRLGERMGTLLHAANLVATLLTPVVVRLSSDMSAFAAYFCLSIYSCIFLKLISFAHVNYWYRLSTNTSASTPGHKGGAKHAKKHKPEHLSLGHVYYFLVAPTLCFEFSFPRSSHIRWWFLCKRLMESVFLLQLIMALGQQWIIPILTNSVQPFVKMDYTRILERLLKLAIPNHLIWLIFFYWLFHSLSNLIAELLRFADREFYGDWWNSETVQVFWKSWNIPVHRFAARHIYKSMLRRGFSRFSAAVAVFLVSAFFHEYFVSVPLRMFRLWAFSGMLVQIPLNFVTTKVLRGGKAGNIVVWLSLIVGQPLAILMYLHDYYVLNHTMSDSNAHQSGAYSFQWRD